MDHWEKLLNPKILRHNLISASMFITAYEYCRSSIVEKAASFFEESWSPEETKISEKYKKEVLSLAKSPLEATLLWFQGLGAIEEADIEKFSEARRLRNKLAHNLPAYISDPEYEIDHGAFIGLLEVTHKLGVWWVVNVELDIDPDYAGEEIDENEIKTGTVLMVQMLMDIAFGNEPEEGYYYKHVSEQKNS